MREDVGRLGACAGGRGGGGGEEWIGTDGDARADDFSLGGARRDVGVANVRQGVLVARAESVWERGDG